VALFARAYEALIAGVDNKRRAWRGQPCMPGLSRTGPLRLVEQTVEKTDPDPKTLACYGLLVRWAQPSGGWHEEAWLRFMDGRPVSALTAQYLAWRCAELQALGKQALLWSGTTPPGTSVVRSGPGFDATPQGQAGRLRRTHPPVLFADQEPLAESDRAQNGCMASAAWSNRRGCCQPSSLLTASVLPSTVPITPISLSPSMQPEMH
jgi:hypothetical protein